MQSNYKRWIVAALPLAMACSVSAQGKVTDVSTRPVEGGLAVHIGGSDLAKPTTKWDGGAFVLEFQTETGPKSTVLRPNSGGIKAISFGKEGHTFNVAIRPKGAKEPQIVQLGDGWLVFFEEGAKDTVTPYTSATTTKAQQKTQKPVASVGSPVNPRDFKPKALVTLNFVDTDIQQIIKALGLQANVNVAMGPDVTGKVTINLDNVPVDEAMEMVTTLGGVRYAYLNNTYVVASNANYSGMMKRMGHRADSNSETRVVALSSRDGNDIKAAILKMVPPNTADGEYELVLPSERLNVFSTQSVTPGAGAPAGKDDKGAQGANATQTDTKVQQASSGDNNKKDDYVVLIGTPGRMDTVEKAVKALDEQICYALGIKVGTSQAIIRKTYEPKGILAQDLVKALVGSDKRDFNDVQILATPGTSVSKQAIVLNGREADVDRVMSMLLDLDKTPDGAETQYEVVGLKFIKPNFAKIQIMQNIPGIRASFLPPPIDPKVGIQYDEMSTSGAPGSTGADGTGAAGAGSGGGAGQSAGGGSGSSGQASGGGTGSSTSLGNNGNPTTGAAVQTSTKSNSVPMKLLLRGTPEQIDAAKKFLMMVDLQPKQVAVELRVMEISSEEALKVGLNWSVLTGGTLQSLNLNQAAFGDNSVPGGLKGGLKFPGGGSLGVLGVLDSISNKNNVLARPSILVNDGVPTDMFVGDEIRYIKSIQSTQQGVTVETDEIDVGVDFTVTARIGDQGNVLVDMNPTLKVLEGFTPVPGGGSLPQTSRRSASSQMSIKSGETIAIGGLIQEQDKKNYGGIPFLKDLPLIGRLFGRTDHDKIRSEVVFFVTVKEVTEADRAGAANPRQAERENKINPGDKNGKGGKGGG